MFFWPLDIFLKIKQLELVHQASFMNDNKEEFNKDIKERLLSAHRKRYASALARSPMIKVVLYGLDSISWAVASRPKAERAAETSNRIGDWISNHIEWNITGSHDVLHLYP